jgi:DNA-binding NtrC family response regulator
VTSGAGDIPPTEQLEVSREPVRRLRLIVISGPDRGTFIALTRGTHKIGKHAGCELVLTDGAVSSQHLQVQVEADRILVKDLGSTNGSWFAGARFTELEIGRGATMTLGKSELRVEAVDAATALAPSSKNRFCELLGSSEPMRRMFTLLERVSKSTASVLIEGETGTGKELVAQALHAASDRASGPYVVCDLASLTASLCESELFGHVRGAFTGADRDREGAFEAAHGGTIFLDEVGELPLDLQPRLLRVLESRQVRRVGETRYRDVDVRVVSATNRDLVDEVRAGRFRADLYHRLGIVPLDVPPLRERRDDIPVLVRHFAESAATATGQLPRALDDQAIAALTAYDWPGNVRELRNVVERAIALGLDISAAALGADRPDRPDRAGRSEGGQYREAVDPSVPFKDAKGRLVDAWERDYVAALLDACGGNVSLAARRAGMDRAYLHRLLKKHGVG